MPEKRRDARLDLGRRRLAFVAVRTTGFDPNVDRIVEVAAVMKKEFVPDRPYRERVDPGVPILPEATRYHGLTDADVAGEKTFEEIAPGLFRFLGAADLVGFGIRRLALPFLAAEFDREGFDLFRSPRSVVDLEEIYEHFHPRDLASAARDYLGGEPSPVEDARAEVATVEKILAVQLARHEGLPTTARELAHFPTPRDPLGLFRGESGMRPFIFAEGRHRGRTPEEVARVDPDYLRSLQGHALLWHAHSLIEVALKHADQPTRRRN
jgi:DNA polymerase III subunit epsilon